MMKHIFAMVIVLCMLPDISCRKSPVAPQPTTNCDFPPGNRNFSWRTDTVAWWPSEVGGVWAFSDTDVYVMGDMHGPAMDGANTTYLSLHWDGKEWGVPGTYNDIQHLSKDVTGDGHFMVSVGYWSVGDDKAGLAEFDNNLKKWTGYEFQMPGDLYSVWTDSKGFFIAVGDNGMIYTKDGYNSQWVYSKAPTSFTLTRIRGVSKTEMYISALLYNAADQEYNQYWKYDGTNWYKLFDNQDTTGNVIALPADYSKMTDVAPYRCPATDSLKLYLAGWNSFLLQSKGQAQNYSVQNLSPALPLHNMGNTAVIVDLFTPNDIWMLSPEYNFYQWNGADFEQVYIPGLPGPETYTGIVRNMTKTQSGKIFFPAEVSPQVYVVAQGTP